MARRRTQTGNSEPPRLLFADDHGNIYDHPTLLMAGFDGTRNVVPAIDDLIVLPEMSRLFFLPDCAPVGYDARAKRFVTLTRTRIDGRNLRCHGVAAFMEPGYARSLLPAARWDKKNYTLPMWAYTAVGFGDDRYVSCGFQVENNPTWDPKNYDDRILPPAVDELLKRYPENRLARHLADCATLNHCFAAKNLFWRRWEAPLPVSRACNAGCLGCISHQQPGTCEASHQRIAFTPTVREITELAVDHLETAAGPIVSFGQGCEGEPLTEGELIAESVAEMRRRTSKGSINLNTNGSMTDRVMNIVDAGLDCIRVSMNSARPDLYRAYYRPQGFDFDDMVRTIAGCVNRGVYTMINYLIFPGVTDQEDEVNALIDLIRQTGVNFVHFKNLCIDPGLYLSSMEPRGTSPIMGIRRVAQTLKETFPHLEIGYFNQPGFKVRKK